MHRSLSLIALVTLVAAVSGCERASDVGTQPRPDVSTFEQGDFDDLPLLPTSEALSPPNEQNGNVARSYVVRNTTPSEVLDFYVQQFAATDIISGPENIGANTFRGRWRLDQGRILTVSATPGSSLDSPADFEEAEVLTQYSLSLAPAEE